VNQGYHQRGQKQQHTYHEGTWYTVVGGEGWGNEFVCVLWGGGSKFRVVLANDILFSFKGR
jgi:hypothetical protein